MTSDLVNASRTLSPCDTWLCDTTCIFPPVLLLRQGQSPHHPALRPVSRRESSFLLGTRRPHGDLGLYILIPDIPPRHWSPPSPTSLDTVELGQEGCWQQVLPLEGRNHNVPFTLPGSWPPVIKGRLTGEKQMFNNMHTSYIHGIYPGELTSQNRPTHHFK